jgi:ATP-binding cassette subfamily B protein
MIKLFKKLSLIQWMMIMLIIILIILQVRFDLALPDYMGEIVKKIQSRGTPEEIWSIGYTMLAITLGSAICTVTVGFLSAFVAAGLSRKIRRDLFQKVNAFSMEEMNDFSTSSLITRSTNDITQIQLVVTIMLRIAITAPVMATGAILKIVAQNMTLTWVTGGAILMLMLLITFMFFFVVPKFKRLQKQIDRVNAVTRENLTGIRVVRAYNAEKNMSDKFEASNADLTKTQLFVNRATSFMMPGMQLIMSGLSLAIIWIGSYLIKEGALNLSNMMIFTQYSMQVLFSFMMLFMLFVFLPRASVSAKRINEVLGKKIRIADGQGVNLDKQINDFVPQEHGTIEFKSVSFRYPESDEDVLEKINLTIHQGETVAFIGSTGSGKSTLINLIPRLYDVTGGEVLVDGHNVKEYTLEQLHDLIGYVPQKGILFSGSVSENVKYGVEKATEEEVKQALDIAQAGFVQEFEDREGHYISQGGKNVSGGQKQRLSIARAVIKKPEIFIFDDSFSALDYKTDRALRQALKKETSGITNVIVAQRIGTIIDADKIVVLEKGRIVGNGTHEELLATCEVYKEIAYSQLSKEELA